MRTQAIFLCPKCDLPLESGARSYVCLRGHAFDVARSGYVNLHQTNCRGDTRAMLLARRAFLERGFFRPIADAINKRVVDHLLRLRAANRLRGDELIVDAGCGEGYYLRRLASHLQRSGTFEHIRLVGIDASKDAIRMTASRLPGYPCAVMDVTHGLHLRCGGAAALLNVFAPRNPAAFAESLMPGGLCLVVVPATGHMKELRRLVPLLDIPPEKQARVARQFGPHLTLARCHRIDYVVQLDPEAARTWVQMGPNAWHLAPDQISAIEFPGTIAARVSCTLMSFMKEPWNLRASVHVSCYASWC